MEQKIDIKLQRWIQFENLGHQRILPQLELFKNLKNASHVTVLLHS